MAGSRGSTRPRVATRGPVVSSVATGGRPTGQVTFRFGVLRPPFARRAPSGALSVSRGVMLSAASCSLPRANGRQDFMDAREQVLALAKAQAPGEPLDPVLADLVRNLVFGDMPSQPPRDQAPRVKRIDGRLYVRHDGPKRYYYECVQPDARPYAPAPASCRSRSRGSARAALRRRRTRSPSRGSPARLPDDPPPSPHRWEKTSIGGSGFDENYHLCVLRGLYHLWGRSHG